MSVIRCLLASKDKSFSFVLLFYQLQKHVHSCRWKKEKTAEVSALTFPFFLKSHQEYPTKEKQVEAKKKMLQLFMQLHY